MVLPVVIDIKFKNGTVTRVKLPVEIWQKNSDWSFKNDSTEEIESITLDPDHVFPDVNSSNNVWSADKGELEKDVILDNYFGNFSSTMIPIKINFTEEEGKLVANATGQPKLSLDIAGKDKFTFDQAGLTPTEKLVFFYEIYFLKRYLLAQTMQCSKSPNQINGINSDDFSVRETFSQYVQSNSILGIIESRNQNTMVQNQEVCITRR